MDPLPLYAVAEYAYCPRSSFYVLTDTPKLNDENAFIQSGRSAHQRVDSGYTHAKGAKTVKSSFRVHSERLNIIGMIDVVEFYPDGRLIPVELKRGKKRVNKMHEIQLSLMALCLKEMFPNTEIAEGAIFFTEDRQKQKVPFTQALLKEAENIAQTVRENTSKDLIPANFPMQKDTRCHGCCFYDLCYF